jgi:ChrB, C-terminal domain
VPRSPRRGRRSLPGGRCRSASCARHAVVRHGRSLGKAASLGPVYEVQPICLAVPFVVAGVTKIGYDFTLWRMFRRVPLADQTPTQSGGIAVKWVSRARHPRTDRIARRWLIRRVIDPDAEILFVPAENVIDEVRRIGGRSVDAPVPTKPTRTGNAPSRCSSSGIAVPTATQR